eukprot:m.317754 g.317754  ORF g.317754 m.317754 type:complete len:104 (-) comp15986_c0_seq18:201-512(-)
MAAAIAETARAFNFTSLSEKAFENKMNYGYNDYASSTSGFPELSTAAILTICVFLPVKPAQIQHMSDVLEGQGIRSRIHTSMSSTVVRHDDIHMPFVLAQQIF